MQIRKMRFFISSWRIQLIPSFCSLLRQLKPLAVYDHFFCLYSLRDQLKSFVLNHVCLWPFCFHLFFILTSLSFLIYLNNESNLMKLIGLFHQFKELRFALCAGNWLMPCKFLWQTWQSILSLVKHIFMCWLKTTFQVLYPETSQNVTRYR